MTTTRALTIEERRRLATGLGVSDLDVTCSGDCGHGPCGTYLDWTDCCCRAGHQIEIAIDDGPVGLTCSCCGGDMPPREIWEARRNDSDAECTGSIDSQGRCRAWSDDSLWESITE